MRLYDSLCKIFREISNIDNITDLLEWDAQVMMPKGSSHNRVTQINTLSRIKHEILTDSTVSQLIQENLKQRDTLNQWQQSNLMHMEKVRNDARAVPVDLLDAFNKTCLLSQDAWRKAKEENKFKIWLPHLQELVSLVSKIAIAKAEFLGCSRYEALLDYYEPNLRICDIDSIFGEIGKFLREFIKKVMEKQTKVAGHVPAFSIETQRDLSRFLLKLVNLPKDRLRIDESVHPFTSGNFFDTRIAVAYDEGDFTKAFRTTLHECGHALYSMNLPSEFSGLPVGCSLGMAMHEAQALLFEKQIGSSFQFISYMTPIFKKVLKGKPWSAKSIYSKINRVQPSSVRIYADEVTYPAHIMIRYTLEKALIENELQVQDLPQAWNEDMNHYLGVAPKNNTEGCLQDIHWASGNFGYFPSYLLGMIISAQLFAKIKRTVPDVMDQVAEGKLGEIIDWLVENIYKHGNRYNMQEIMKMAVGEQLNPAHYIKYLEEKYCPG